MNIYVSSKTVGEFCVTDRLTGEDGAFGNSASLDQLACIKREARLWQRVVLLVFDDFFAGCWCLRGLALTDSGNSTGYPITAVYSRARLPFHSSHRRSLSAFAADMRL